MWYANLLILCICIYIHIDSMIRYWKRIIHGSALIMFREDSVPWGTYVIDIERETLIIVKSLQ